MAVVDIDVRSIIEVADSLDLTAFLVTANLMRTEDLGNTSLSDARLDQIETYLAAHFAALFVERGALKSTTTLNAGDAYAGDYGRGLRATRYGQQAIVLDTSGTLSTMAEPAARAQFRVV